MFIVYWLTFIMAYPPLTQETSPTLFLDMYPVFDTHLELLKRPSGLFRLDFPNLDILMIEDILGMPFDSIMPFHNDVSI